MYSTIHPPALRLIVLGLAFSACSSLRAAEPDAKGLVGHWPLSGDAQDVSGHNRHGQPRQVKFLPAEGDQPASTAFDGTGSVVEVESQAVQPGTGDFSIALWLHTEESLDDDLGELVSQFDSQTRRGFSLSLRNNCVTSSQSNVRQLQFGIDNGSIPTWTDLGRPGQALLGFCLCVHDGRLYCGTCEPGLDQAGHVYRHEEGSTWTDLGSPDKSNSVIAAATFHGQLYVATGKYRLAGSSLPESENTELGGRVFRLDEGDRWNLVGQLPGVEAVASLVVFRDQLYASSLFRPAGFFRYDGEQNWTALGTPGGKRPESMSVYNGYLWATGYDEGHIYRFDGHDWQDMGQVGENTQTYSFATMQGQLHVGTWPSCRVYRWSPDGRWLDTGRLGEELEVMGMLLHNGKLYAGSLPLAEMFRHDGDDNWHSLGRLDLTPDVKYRRVWTCAQYQGRLIASTLPSGHLFAMEAGKCVTHDRQLAAGWQHITAVRDRGRLRLYVGGQPVAESTAFSPARFDLSNEQPLLIGGGPGDYFNGRLRDVRIYQRALSPREIAELATLAE
ncbi:MAG: LamG-like jellyroll fold domain-containing protein [Pirellulales bacterium]